MILGALELRIYTLRDNQYSEGPNNYAYNVKFIGSNLMFTMLQKTKKYLKKVCVLYVDTFIS